MKTPTKPRVLLINLFIALAISLIVNFSNFLFSIMASQGMFSQGNQAKAPPDFNLHIWIQVAYWVLFAFILLWIVTRRIDSVNSKRKFVTRIICCCVVALIFYYLTPTTSRAGEFTIVAFANRMINPMVLLKSSFTLIVSVLYGKIFELVYQKQGIVIENEQLKNENLLTRYNMLVSQINPHFFFNSLNSLSMLVRAKDNDKALTYIDRLSDTFRHIIQKGQNDMTTLGDEMEFVAGYKYVHEVRYADKLFFDIDIKEEYLNWRLPALSLQPLIENAVKHNSITLSKPFHVSIRTEGDELVVSNPVIPKIDPEQGTGIGLKNLSSRFILLTGEDIVVENKQGLFSVKLPLTKPE